MRPEWAASRREGNSLSDRAISRCPRGCDTGTCGTFLHAEDEHATNDVAVDLDAELGEEDQYCLGRKDYDPDPASCSGNTKEPYDAAPSSVESPRPISRNQQ